MKIFVLVLATFATVSSALASVSASERKHTKAHHVARHTDSGETADERNYNAQRKHYAPIIQSREDAQQAADEQAATNLFMSAAAGAGVQIARIHNGYAYRADGVMCQISFERDGMEPQFYEGSVDQCADGSPSVSFGNCDPEMGYKLTDGRCEDESGNMEFFNCWQRGEDDCRRD